MSYILTFFAGIAFVIFVLWLANKLERKFAGHKLEIEIQKESENGK